MWLPRLRSGARYSNACHPSHMPWGIRRPKGKRIRHSRPGPRRWLTGKKGPAAKPDSCQDPHAGESHLHKLFSECHMGATVCPHGCACVCDFFLRKKSTLPSAFGVSSRWISVSSRLTWTTHQVPGLCQETLSLNTNIAGAMKQFYAWGSPQREEPC